MKKMAFVLYILTIILLFAFIWFGVLWANAECSAVPAVALGVVCFACVGVAGVLNGRSY